MKKTMKYLRTVIQCPGRDSNHLLNICQKCYHLSHFSQCNCKLYSTQWEGWNWGGGTQKVYYSFILILNKPPVRTSLNQTKYDISQYIPFKTKKYNFQMLLFKLGKSFLCKFYKLHLKYCQWTQEWKNGMWNPTTAFYSTKIRNLTMGSCDDMQGDNTDNSTFTIPTGADHQEPASHPPQTQPEHFLSLLTSTFKMDADFTGNISNRENWEMMQNTKTQSIWTMNHHESSKLGHITVCHDLDWQSEL